MDTFNFARYHFLRPMVIYAGFALALKIISLQGHSWAKTAKWFAVLQILLLGLYNDEIIYQKKPTVKEFFAEELFHEIKEHIGQATKELSSRKYWNSSQPFLSIMVFTHLIPIIIFIH